MNWLITFISLFTFLNCYAQNNTTWNGYETNAPYYNPTIQNVVGTADTDFLRTYNNQRIIQDSYRNGWKIFKRRDTDRNYSAEYSGEFKKGITDWNPAIPEMGKVEMENNKLHILFNKDVSGDLEQFGGAYLKSPFDDLNEYDFSFATTIESKITNNLACGIMFGDWDDNRSFYRIGIVNRANRIVCEHFNDGLFVYQDDTDFDISRHVRNNAINELRIDKKGTTINIYVNGGIIGELENVNIVGANIAIFGIGSANTHAYFNDFRLRIDPSDKIISIIPLKTINGIYSLNVQLNGVLSIDFIFDPGASDVSISPDVALTLIKTGTIKKEDWLPGLYYQFADGSTAKSKRFKLKSVKIGDRLIQNVNCSISNSVDAPMLLGQSFLRRLGKYTFDYAHKTIKIQ